LGLDLALLNTIAAIAAIALWLNAGKKIAFAFGFFAALLWFWWIGLSFLYTQYPILAPFAALVVAFSYAVLFWAIAFLPLWARVFAIAFAFSWIEPFGFAWFKPELILGSGYFSTHSFAYPILVFSCYFFIFGFKRARDFGYRAACGAIGAILLIVCFVLPAPKRPDFPALEIELAQTDISQSIKWEPADLPRQTLEVFELINKAIEARKDTIVLPEAAFATFLNRDRALLDKLALKSFSISIVAGGLHLKGNQPYNSAYIFKDGEYEIADKVFLVPFGEASPLPKWAGRWINTLFFGGAVDYQTAAKPTDFTIKNYGFRIAICYEAGIEAMYKKSPPYMIAISNNGWFIPSIEPTLQKLLMRLYARRYGKIIWHSSNESPSEIIY
jgi:apolipoprotein N-acyltransferase